MRKNIFNSLILRTMDVPSPAVLQYFFSISSVDHCKTTEEVLLKYCISMLSVSKIDLRDKNMHPVDLPD